MKLRAPQSITFERADGSKIAVPPVTRGQIREVYALDPEPMEAAGRTPLDASEQRAEQLAILLVQAICTDAAGSPVSVAWMLDSLTVIEEHDILTALIAAHHGIDPERATDTARALRELAARELKKKAVRKRGKTS